ncbi:MAG: RimK family alpha-L-glutamate ligase [Alphaproteobacteria bacterium]|nr:RimK family alpha-L-glutamate ligase [Alphaproteobacteria bacterium]
MPRIALASDAFDWHARTITHALRTLGAEVVRLRLPAATFATGSRYGLDLPGFDGALPDAVLVRAIAAGTFEAVTRRLGVLHALRECGVPVWNDARAIERCVDKSMTSFLLAQAGVATPPTWTVEGLAQARAVVAAEAGAAGLVLKPLFGSQGKGLRLIARPDDLPAEEAVGAVYYLQRYVPPADGAFRDHRLFVVAGEVIAAMSRRGTSWVTNIRQGGAPEPLVPDRGMIELALRAAACVGADYAGVDLLRERAGALMVLEVNSMPAWQGLQQVTDVNVALRLAAALLARLRWPAPTRPR